jgi:hypothetical protein
MRRDANVAVDEASAVARCVRQLFSKALELMRAMMLTSC